MSKEVWDGNIAKLPKDYLSKVKMMMKSQCAVGVRFGITGKGVHPNYELALAGGTTQPMSGQNHEKFRDYEEFDKTNITQLFNLSDIEAAQLMFG